MWGTHEVSIGPADPARPIIDAWWSREFAALPAARHVLEIGAGAGTIAALMANAVWPQAQITACDVRGGSDNPGRNIHYVADAPIEALPFADASFDMVAGMFAFEYADPAAAVSEVCRVLRPGGGVRLLLHHPHSHMSRVRAHRQRCIDLGVRLLGLIRAAGLARSLRNQRLARLVRDIEAALTTYADPPITADAVADLQDMRQIAAAYLLGPVSAPARVAAMDFLQSCEASAVLLKAQTAATLSNAALATRLNLLSASQMIAVEHGRLTDRLWPLAWTVRATKPAAAAA